MSVELSKVEKPLTFSLANDAAPYKIISQNEYGLYMFDVDVVFKKGNRKVGFFVEAPSLKVAFESIEAFGRQLAEMDDPQFKKFHTKHAGKTVFRTPMSHDKAQKESTISFYRLDRVKRDIQVAFKDKTGKTDHFKVKLDTKTLDEVDKLAKLHENHHLGSKNKKKKVNVKLDEVK